MQSAARAAAARAPPAAAPPASLPRRLLAEEALDRLADTLGRTPGRFQSLLSDRAGALGQAFDADAEHIAERRGDAGGEAFVQLEVRIVELAVECELDGDPVVLVLHETDHRGARHAHESAAGLQFKTIE